MQLGKPDHKIKNLLIALNVNWIGDVCSYPESSPIPFAIGLVLGRSSYCYGGMFTELPV
jgi:hypothetical protein